MQYAIALPVLSLLASAEAAETVLGAFVFHRHGDRTPKALAPTNLTTLGYEQVYTSGQYYRSRYLDGASSSKIRGINEDVVKLSQVAVTAPVDNVLQNSAMAFLQALYPPVGPSLSAQELPNGDRVEAPMDGYQLIPVNTVAVGSGSEDNGWLQDASGCYKAKLSSNEYFYSAEYKRLSESTKDFYTSLDPVVNATLGPDELNYKNAYLVYDLIHVAEIHNSTIPDSEILTNETLLQLKTLADAHEWGLAYNASDNTRAISGMQWAGEVLKHMNSTIASGHAGSSSNKLGVQFGAYATFMSLFGLMDMPKVSSDFTGIVDYASSAAFELFTNADVSRGFPSNDDLQVRFLFHNGSASNTSAPTTFPMFGGSANEMSWNDFENAMSSFAVSTTEDWCNKCGNTTGTCAQYAPASNNAGAQDSGHGGNHMSAAVGGVIGAFVTVAVFLILLAIMTLLGLRLVSKKRLTGNSTPAGETAAKMA